MKVSFLKANFSNDFHPGVEHMYPDEFVMSPGYSKTISPDCPDYWERFFPVKNGWLLAFKKETMKVGDRYSVSIVNRVDDRLASGYQTFSKTFYYEIKEIRNDCLIVEEIQMETGHSKTYPEYGKNRRIK